MLGVVNYCAIDPGPHTGLAFVVNENEYRTYTLTGKEEVWSFLALLENKCDSIIVEVYSTANRVSKYGIQTIEIIGGVDAFCAITGRKCVRRQPQQRKAFIDKARAYLHNTNKSEFTEHEVDALAHLMSWEHENETKNNEVFYGSATSTYQREI